MLSLRMGTGSFLHDLCPDLPCPGVPVPKAIHVQVPRKDRWTMKDWSRGEFGVSGTGGATPGEGVVGELCAAHAVHRGMCVWLHP